MVTGNSMGMSGIMVDLESYLEKQDLVVMIDTDGANLLVSQLCQSDAISKTKKHIVFISSVNFPMKPGSHIYLSIPEKEMESLIGLYRSYEASDKLMLLSDSRNYGSLWNYVSDGIVSSEELFESMLT